MEFFPKIHENFALLRLLNPSSLLLGDDVRYAHEASEWERGSYSQLQYMAVSWPWEMRRRGGWGAEEAGNKVEHRALAALLLPPPALWREIKKCRVSERMGWWTCFMCCWCGSKDWLCWCGQPPPPPFSMLSFGICACLSPEQIKGQLLWPFSVASVLLNGTLSSYTDWKPTKWFSVLGAHDKVSIHC